MPNQPVEHEKLLAFIDGTLDPDEASAITERMGHDEDLRRQVSTMIEEKNGATPPPFPNPVDVSDSSAPSLPAPEAEEKPWRRLLNSIRGQSKTENRFAALAIGSLAAAAVSGLVFLLYLDKTIVVDQQAKTAEPTTAETAAAAPPPTEAPAEANAAAPAAPPTEPPPADAAAPAADTPAPAVEPMNAEPTTVATEPAKAAEPAPVEAAQPPPAQASETAAPAPEPVTAAKESAAASGRFAVLAKDCAVHAEADANSKAVNQMTQGQRLWTEPAVDGWKKVYRKKGVAFIQEDCFVAEAAKEKPSSKRSKPASKAKETKADPLRDEATELSDQPVAAAAPAKPGQFYMTLLARGETKVDGATDPANAIGTLAEHLDGNTNCLPMSIATDKLGDTVTLHLQVKADGSVRKARLEPKVAGADKIAACFQARLTAAKSALTGKKDGNWAIVLRVQ